MSRHLTRTTSAGLAGIAMLLSAASVLAQGAGGGMSRPDDRGDRMDRAPRVVEGYMLRHDDVVPPPPQPNISDRVIERRGFKLDPHGGGPGGGSRTQGLSERLEHRIRVLEDRIRILSDALRSKMHSRSETESRGHRPLQTRNGYASSGGQFEGQFQGQLRELIERRLDAREDRGEDRRGGQGQPRGGAVEGQLHRGPNGPHVIHLDHGGPGGSGGPGGPDGTSGTWEMRIEGLDGRNLFRGQLEHAPVGPDGPHGNARGAHPTGPGNDQHEFIIQLRGQNDDHGASDLHHRVIEEQLDGPRSGPGAEHGVIEKRIFIDSRDDQNGPRPAQHRKRIRLDDVQHDNVLDAQPRHIIIEEQVDSGHAAPPAPPAPPHAPAAPRSPNAPRAPRGPAGRDSDQPGPDRAPLHRRDRGAVQHDQNISSADMIESPDNLYQVALAAFAVPPEADAQPTPKQHAASRSNVTVVADSAHGDKGDQTVTVIEDDDAVTVRMENGKVASVERNGKKVPMDRIRQEDGKLKITDESGKVVYEMKLNAGPTPPPPPPAPARGRAEVRVDRTDAAPARPLAPGQLRIKGNKVENVPGGVAELTIDEAPKVIVGIQMAEPDRSLIGHFGLKPGEVTMVSGVYENLPASIAGIDLYDIIVAIDGKSPAGQDDVRKALRSKKDGDTATFTVIHKGARNDVQLKLIPYAPDKLESAKLNAIPVETDIMQGMGGNGQIFITPDSEQWRALTENPDFKGQLDTKILEHLDRARNMSEDAGARANEATKRRVDRLREIRPEATRPGQPLAPRADGPAGGERVQNLEERLDRLEKMIERLLDRQGGNNPPPAPGGRGGPRTSGNES